MLTRNRLLVVAVALLAGLAVLAVSQGRILPGPRAQNYSKEDVARTIASLVAQPDSFAGLSELSEDQVARINSESAALRKSPGPTFPELLCKYVPILCKIRDQYPAMIASVRIEPAQGTLGRDLEPEVHGPALENEATKGKWKISINFSVPKGGGWSVGLVFEPV